MSNLSLPSTSLSMSIPTSRLPLMAEFLADAVSIHCLSFSPPFFLEATQVRFSLTESHVTKSIAINSSMTSLVD